MMDRTDEDRAEPICPACKEPITDHDGAATKACHDYLSGWTGRQP